MTNIVRWDPFREMLSMRQLMDRLFDESFNRQLESVQDWNAPAVDLYQTANDVIVKASLPGMKAEDIQISITGDVLTLSGEMKEEKEVDEVAYHLRERRFGRFSRTIQLPSAVITDKASAVFENGVLTLTLPKAEETRAKTIAVKVK